MRKKDHSMMPIENEEEVCEDLVGFHDEDLVDFDEMDDLRQILAMSWISFSEEDVVANQADQDQVKTYK